MTPEPGARVDHESINTVDLAMDAAGETVAAADLGDFAGAVAKAQAAVAAGPRAAVALTVLAIALQAQGRTSEAVAARRRLRSP